MQHAQLGQHSPKELPGQVKLQGLVAGLVRNLQDTAAPVKTGQRLMVWTGLC